RVLMKHIVGNALLPMITLAGMQVPTILGGALVTETVFTWPGMGRLFLDSLGYSDYPVVMGLLMLSAIFTILGNLLADIIVATVDPRVRLGWHPIWSYFMSSTVLAIPERRGWWHSRAVKRFARHRLALVGIFLFTALTLACFIGPWF